MTTTNSPLLRLRAVCAAAAACALAAPALAQQSPFSAGVVQGLSSDSNVYRSATGSDVKSDVISSTGLRLGVDQAFGRQRWVGSADANVNRYASQKALNNNDYQIGSRLEWTTIERLSGILSGGVKQSLYRLDTNGGQQFSQRNMLRSGNLGLQAQLGVVTDLSFDGGVSASRDRYSAAAFASNDIDQKSANFGLRLQPGSGLTVRVGVRHGVSTYTSSIDKIKRDDIDLSSVVDLTGASSLNARLSRTRQRHDAVTQPDTRSWTGALGWKWRPLGKLSFDLILSRDSAAGATNFDFQLPNVTSNTSFASSNTNVQNRLGLRADWDLAAAWKIGSELNVSHRSLNALSSLNNTTVSAQDQNDRTVTFNLGVRYLPMRNVELGCSVGREDRSTDSAGTSALTYAYTVTTVGCNAQIYLR